MDGFRLRSGACATYQPGPGLFGELDRTGERCQLHERVREPHATDGTRWIVTWERDGRESAVLEVDLRWAPPRPSVPAPAELRRAANRQPGLFPTEVL